MIIGRYKINQSFDGCIKSFGGSYQPETQKYRNPFHSTDANDKSGYGYDYNGYAMNPSVMFFTQETAYACKGIGKTFYSFL